MPLPGVIGDPGSDLDEPFDQLLDRAPDPLAHDVEPAEHVKQVVGQGPHLEAGKVGPEAVAAGLIPAKGRIDSEMISVVAVLVARRDLINTLANHLDQQMPSVNG